MMRNSFVFIIASIVLLTLGCNPSINPSFTYTPEEPRAGQTISFTNTTNEGEYWNWNFGDGTNSTYKNPSKVYKKPGTYTVSLCVDSNSNYTTQQSIIVYDTIPYIDIDVDSVFYYQTFTVNALVYNPYKKKVSYKWSFSDHAISEAIKQGESNDSHVELFFNHYNTEETLRLEVTIGDSIYHVERTVYVHDFKSSSLLMTDATGLLWKQRLYENGTEEPTQIATYLPQVHLIGIYGGQLYLAESDIQLTNPSAWEDNLSGTCRLMVHDLNNQQNQTILTIEEHPQHHLFRAHIRNGQIYWSDYDDYLYKTPTSTRNATFTWNEANPTTNAYYLVCAERLGYYGHTLAKGQATGGISLYADTYFWAKYNEGNGIYRFTSEDILTNAPTTTTPQPESGHILAQYPIKHFSIDAIHRKIYYLTPSASNNELWVCNIDGRNTVRIAEHCGDALFIDNASNRLYYVDTDGVKSMRLVSTSDNLIYETGETVSTVQATRLVVDAHKR